MVGFLDFIIEYKIAITFYLLILFFVIYNWKKFDVEAKFILLYRTKFGLNFINNVSHKWKEYIKLYGYIGVGFGFFGMLIITVMILYSFYRLLINPSPEFAIVPLIPGVKIPGSPVFVPLLEGVVAIFIVALVHEMSHGIVSRAHGNPIKSSGVVFFGPIIGAFVEPDEKKLEKQSSIEQYSVFAAGPFANLVLALLVFGLLTLSSALVYSHFVDPVGIEVAGVFNGSAAYNAGLKEGMIITSVNGYTISTRDDFVNLIRYNGFDKDINIVADGKTYSFRPTPREDNPSIPYLGVTSSYKYELKDSVAVSNGKYVYYFLTWFNSFLELLFMISLGIGLINLLPLGIVDGGRMLQRFLLDVSTDKAKGMKLWGAISLFFFAVLIASIILSFVNL